MRCTPHRRRTQPPSDPVGARGVRTTGRGPSSTIPGASCLDRFGAAGSIARIRPEYSGYIPEYSLLFQGIFHLRHAECCSRASAAASARMSAGPRGAAPLLSALEMVPWPTPRRLAATDWVRPRRERQLARSAPVRMARFSERVGLSAGGSAWLGRFKSSAVAVATASRKSSATRRRSGRVGDFSGRRAGRSSAGLDGWAAGVAGRSARLTVASDRRLLVLCRLTVFFREPSGERIVDGCACTVRAAALVCLVLRASSSRWTASRHLCSSRARCCRRAALVASSS